MEDTSDEDDFKKTSTHFLDWLRNNEVTISAKIELADLRDRLTGRGVLATDDIEEDEELFSIPKSSILTVGTSSLPKEVKEDLNDPWLSLIVAMVYEYQLGIESRWKQYFDVLPEQFDTLIYWSEKELEYLRGSAIVQKIGKTSADSMFLDQVMPLMRENMLTPRAQKFNKDEMLSLCHRMGSTIMAYAFDLENSSRTEEDGWEEDSDSDVVLPKGMVPMADMLNADADRNNAKLFCEDDKVVMKTIKAVKKGEELFNDYGPLPRAEVLRRYGYVTENYAKYDVVEISLNVIKDAALGDLKIGDLEVESRLGYLDEREALDDGYVICLASNDDGQFPEELQALLNMLAMPRDEFDRLKAKGKLPKLGLSNDALRLLYGILLRRRALYPLDDGTSNGIIDNSDRRRNKASQVIRGELEVLGEAAKTVQNQLNDGQKRRQYNFEDDSRGLQQSSKKLRDNDGR